MKVLMINTVSTQRNGVTNVICNLHGAMDKSDMTVDLMAINSPEELYINRFEEAGGKVTVIPRSIAHPVRYVNALRKLIRREGYDIVHAHGNSATLTLEMLAAKLGGCKVRIAHSHNTTCSYMTVHKLLKPIFLKLCTHRLACSEGAGKWLFPKRSFTVVNNGIDTGRFAYDPGQRAQIRAELGVAEDCVLLGHVGLFNDAKNQDFLVRLLQHLLEQGGNYKLVLVGQGPRRETVMQLAQQLGVAEQVSFIQVTDRVESYLAAYDVFCMPSFYEGLPVALIEAQTSGLMCLVADTVTQEADKTGNMIFLPIDKGVQIWAEQLKSMQLPHDRAACAQTAAASICSCGYDIARQAQKVKEFYGKALKD